jgi:hypothetical protein
VDELNVIRGAVVAASVRIHQKRDLDYWNCHCRSQAARALGPVFERQLLTYLKFIVAKRSSLTPKRRFMKVGIRLIANRAGHALWPRALGAPVCERCPFPAQGSPIICHRICE